MCIHTHHDSKLMRHLTMALLAGYAAHPVTLVNSSKNPHEHFTLYASGLQGAQRAADLLNAWHPRYRGNWAAFTDESFPHIHDNGPRKPAFPSIEWPEEPSPNFVAAICFAYGTMTRDVPEPQRCFDYARDQLLAGPERDLALQLISVIRGVDYAASEAPAEAKVYRVVYRDENGDCVTDTYDDTHEVQVAPGGVLAVTKEDGTMAALYADGTWETVR